MRLNLSFKKRLRRFSRHLPALLWLVLLAVPASLRPGSEPSSAPDNGQQAETGRRLIHLLDYVSRDYGGAVANHQVLSQTEYAEQVEFAHEIARLSDGLGELKNDPSIGQELGLLQQSITDKADPDNVTRLCQSLRQKIIQQLALITFPTVKPDMKQGLLYYTKNCASCHGLSGAGDGPASVNLKPKPADLTSERMAGISPYQISNTVRFGIKGTGMAAHSGMDNESLWNIAFYVASLRHPMLIAASGSTPSGALPPAPEILLKELAARTDRELLAGGPKRPGLTVDQLARLRRDPPAPVIGHSDFSYARDRLAGALAAYQANDPETARRMALDAYLEGVEPFEPTLRPDHGAYVSQLEDGLARVRSGISREQSPVALAEAVRQADQLLLRGDSLLENHALSPAVAFTTAVAILLREGLEALLIVVMLLGIAGNTGMRGARVAAHLGWITALAAGLLTWAASLWLMRFSGAGRETLEGVTALIAVAVLIYVGFWLHSKTEISRWHGFLQAKSLLGDSRAGRWGIFIAAFLAVYREAFETVLFYQTLWLRAEGATRQLLLFGIGTGFLLVFALGWLLLYAGRKIPLRKLFQFSAIIMLMLAVILAGKGFHAFQESGLLQITFVNWLSSLKIREQLEFFGIYTTLETLVPQTTTLIIAIGLWWAGNRAAKRGKPEDQGSASADSATTQAPQPT